MFLTKDELKTTGVPEVINKVTNGDDTIITDVIAETIDEMKGYLGVYYDAKAIFEATLENRNKTVLKYLKKIVVYELYKRKENLLDDDTISSYEDAMEWLKNIAKGVLSANLPVKPKDQGSNPNGDGFIKFGSNLKYATNY
ncbi:DUF1320 family protein [Tenacibaculum maritimum]|nr:DUF1320 family protein [Tenacibaculum maritimum]MDB0612167.1 DUF1320 family protein [Tenacibaculum maritimum]